MKYILFFVILFINLKGATAQDCKQTGTLIFIRNTGIIRGFIANVYIRDSLLLSITHHDCKVIELPEGLYTLTCRTGNNIEGFHSNAIKVMVKKGSVSFFRFFQYDDFSGPLPGNSIHSLKLSAVTQKKPIKKFLRKKFVRKEIAQHLFSLFMTDQLK